MRSFAKYKPFSILAMGLISVLGAEVAAHQWRGRSAVDRGKSGIYKDSLNYYPPSTEGVAVQTLPIEESQVGFLTHDRGRRYAFFDRKKSQGMELLCLEYDGNSPRFFFDLFNHPPERCMASTGVEVTTRYENEIVEVAGNRCMLQQLKVTEPNTKEVRYIFKLTWVHPDYPLDYGAAIHVKRIQAALAAVPPPPARLLMAGVYGFETEAEARTFFDTQVLENLKI